MVNATNKPLVKGVFKYYLKPNFNLNLSGNYFSLSNKDVFDDKYSSFDLNAELILLPTNQISPYFYGGPGLGFNSNFNENHFKFQYGGGLEFLVSKRLGIALFAEQNMTFTDELDYKHYGKRDDYYWRFGFGITFYMNKFDK